jgi:hypothetical protein
MSLPPQDHPSLPLGRHVRSGELPAPTGVPEPAQDSGLRQSTDATSREGEGAGSFRAAKKRRSLPGRRGCAVLGGEGRSTATSRSCVLVCRGVHRSSGTGICLSNPPRRSDVDECSRGSHHVVAAIRRDSRSREKPLETARVPSQEATEKERRVTADQRKVARHGELTDVRDPALLVLGHGSVTSGSPRASTRRRRDVDRSASSPRP